MQDSLDAFVPPQVKHKQTPAGREAAAVQRRRDAEAARQERIFNVKQRTIGIDTDSIQKQINAKKEAAALEKSREAMLDKAMIDAALQTETLQQEMDRVKKQREREVAEYRAKNQQKTARREWDLSDPDRVKKDTVPTDHPEMLGLSSAQLFPGMDQTNDERKGKQAQQLREWCAAQIADKEKAKAAEVDAERKYCQTQEEVQDQLNQLISAHNTTKQDYVLANAKDNAALAAQKLAEKEAAKRAEDEANQHDINAAMASAFLSEDPATTVSATNPNRPIPYHFKGLPTEYQQYVLETQMQQAQASQSQKVEQQRDEKLWDQFMLSQNNEATKMERMTQLARANQLKELRGYQLQQAEATKVRRQEEYATLTSAPTDQFFGQFGTSSR